MTGLEGNRQIYLPREIQYRLPKSFPKTSWGGDPESAEVNRTSWGGYPESAEVNRNSWGGDPESQGANRSAYYPRDQSLFVLLYHYVTQRKKMIILIGS